MNCQTLGRCMRRIPGEYKGGPRTQQVPHHLSQPCGWHCLGLLSARKKYLLTFEKILERDHGPADPPSPDLSGDTLLRSSQPQHTQQIRGCSAWNKGETGRYIGFRTTNSYLYVYSDIILYSFQGAWYQDGLVELQKDLNSASGGNSLNVCLRMSRWCCQNYHKLTPWTFFLFLFQDPAALKNLRRLSITNNLEILRDRLLREMARKNTNTNAQVDKNIIQIYHSILE